MKSSLLHPRPHRPKRLPLPTHHPIAKRSLVTAQFASPNLRRKQRTLSGAVPRVGTTCTRTASSNGQGAKPGRRFDVCIGKTGLDAAERTDSTDALSAVRHGVETRTRSSESRTPGKSMARDT